MILIDRRIGSKDLLKPLLALGLETELAELDAGDIAFEGKGTGGVSVAVGLELKSIQSSDLINSIRSGRLAGEQLPKMRQTYEYCWLIVEGQWAHDNTDQIVIYQGPIKQWQPVRGHMSASELEKHLFTLDLCGGIRVRYTNRRRDTLRVIRTLYRWFTDRSLDEHTSHLAVYTVPTFLPLSEFRQVVSQFPGVGLKMSKGAEEAFEGSLQRAVMASVLQWSQVASTNNQGKQRRLGTAVAQRIVTFCKGS